MGLQVKGDGRVSGKRAMNMEMMGEGGIAGQRERKEGAITELAFWWPRRGESSAWLEHAPFADWLLATLRPATFVQLGAARGLVYMTWRSLAARAGLDMTSYAVDAWREHSFDGIDGEAVLDELCAADAQARGRRSQFVDDDVLAAVCRVAAGSVDLLHVDAARGDLWGPQLLEAWLPTLSSRGVMVVHGVAREGAGRVLWANLAKRYPSFEFAYGDGLGVVAVGMDVTPELRALCEAGAEEISSIRSHFGRLGAEVAARALQKRLEQAQLALEATQEKLAASEGELVLVREALTRATEAERTAERDCVMIQDRLDAATDDLEHESEALRNANEDLRRARDELGMLRGSTSWRVTAPLRLVVTTFRTPRTVASRAKHFSGAIRHAVSEYGWSGTVRKAVAAARRQGIGGLLRRAAPGTAVKPVHTLPPALPARNHLALRVLIIAEMSIPQCRKYRVTQKQQLILQLGVDCTVVSWTEIEQCRSLLQTHSAVFFYRVPGFPEPLRIIREARSLGLPTFWEVDDIIFDAEEYTGNSNLGDLNEETRRSVLEGVPLYRAAMLACEYGIASTTGLADSMRRAGVPEVFVVENALDKETQRVARKLESVPRRRDGIVRIVYGSGTKTHDADFRVAAQALKRVLRARPHVHLVVIGELNLPSDYREVQAQVERLPLSDYPTYLKRLASCDISIAPLEDSVFNDAKSNIKFLEASIVRLPSVCSPSAAFKSAIRHADTGFLAQDDATWERALLALVDDADLREDVAQRAYAYVSTHYAPVTIAKEQVAPLLEPLQAERRKIRVLGVNIYFAPYSFGGATIVAEEIGRRLNRRDDIEYAMFTSLPTSEVPRYKLVRYSAVGGDAFAMGLPPEANPTFEFENPNSVPAFAEAVRALRPDVVHLHSIQGIGAQIAEVCLRERIPFVVTLHDAWWICGRQFMITGESQYCYQRKIDLNICATCVKDASLNTYRQFRLREILLSASRLLAPSEFFRQLYAENGFDIERIVVNKNGIGVPRREIRREALNGRPLRFGYVGGETQIKGAPLIRKALRSLPDRNYELHVVDNVLNLGRRSIDPKQWAVPGTLKIVPAYTQETIDSFFENIDVLLFPTQWKESFGLSVREALIRDVWVIATDAGGVVEDIVAGENGDIIALDDDGTELAAAISRLLAEPHRLDGFRNPYADRIRLFDEQALELNALFAEVVAEAAASTELPEQDSGDMRVARV